MIQTTVSTKYAQGVQLVKELQEKVQALLDEYDQEFQLLYPGSDIFCKVSAVPTFDVDMPTDVFQSFDIVHDGRDACTYFYYRVGDMNIRERVKVW